jgi:uncharacterized protein
MKLSTPISDLDERPAFEFRNGRAVLLGSRCVACDAHSFPARPVCPSCESRTVESVDLSQVGELYSWTRVHVGARKTPYAVGYVDFPTGAGLVRAFGELDPQTADWSIGERVRPTLAGDESAAGWMFEVAR